MPGILRIWTCTIEVKGRAALSQSSKAEGLALTGNKAAESMRPRVDKNLVLD